MKRFFKTFFSVLLSMTMVFGCVSAFAAEKNNELLWDYFGSEYTYCIAGEITEGNNSLTVPDETYNFCYKLDVKESGYYTIGFSDYDFDGWIGIPEEIDGLSANGELDYLYFSNEEQHTEFTYKFDEGTTYVCFDAYTLFENQNFEVIYQGKSIESIEFEGSLLLNRDVYFYENTCEILADSVVTFSSGNTTRLSYLYTDATDECKNGTNTVKYTYFGEIIDLEIDVTFITDIIKDAEIANVGDYLNAKVFYEGYEGYLPLDETITFTFSDGSKFESVYESYNDNYITLPDGSEIYYYIYTAKNDDGNITLYIESAGTDIKAYECNETKATFDENLITFISNEKFNLDRISRYFRQSLIALLECDSFEELKEYGFYEWKYNIENSFEYFLLLFSEITSLIRFYMG